MNLGSHTPAKNEVSLKVQLQDEASSGSIIWNNESHEAMKLIQLASFDLQSVFA
jgi:hypothetical protein